MYLIAVEICKKEIPQPFALINTCPCMCVCQREGALGDDDSADMDGENGRGFEEYEWAGQKRIRATALLEGGFRGTSTHTHTDIPGRVQSHPS